MNIKVAQNFSANTWKGEQFSLESLKGSKVWLAFFRYASCPLCNLRISQMITRHQELTDKNLKIVAVFQSSGDSISEYVGKQAPPFTMLADPDEELYKLYGLESNLLGFLQPRNLLSAAKGMAKGFFPGKIEGSLGRIPGDFLLDEKLNIIDSFMGEAIGDHIPFERVEAFIK